MTQDSTGAHIVPPLPISLPLYWPKPVRPGLVTNYYGSVRVIIRRVAKQEAHHQVGLGETRAA